MPRLPGRYTGSTSSAPVLAVRRLKLPFCRPLLPSVYSQMFQRPVQAATPSMVLVLLAGQRIEKAIFLPS
jgi:hypothetical protein